jgi:hypothetical protein
MNSKYKKIVQPLLETVCEPIKDWPEAERPREKLVQLGPETSILILFRVDQENCFGISR